jgi:phosphotransacetylase
MSNAAPNADAHIGKSASGVRLMRLIERAKELGPIATAVVHAVEPISLKGAIAAAEAGLIIPTFVGPRAKISKAAEEANVCLDDYKMLNAEHSHAAAAAAVALARTGRVQAIMKGALHTDEIMAEVVSNEGGLRTERRVSHVFVMDAPAYPKLLFVTDAAINIAPTLDEKRDMIQNAIELARTLGVETPKVAVLSAVETVYSKIPSTLDAAALCKMAERGQITGGLVDGPLGFDNAVSKEAARAKGLTSDVAGDADILVAPDIDAGNMLAKQLDYLAGAVAAGIVLGARVPIILTSRAETTLPRVASCAIANIYARRRAEAAS